MPQNHLTLTRQTLYDLAWSRPMSDFAKDFGISDVALAKRCRAVDVPIPYRGYWTKRAAGQEPAKLPLPKYRTRTPPETASPTTSPTKKVAKEILRDFEEPSVDFGLPTELSPPELPPDPSAQTLQQRIEALELTHANTIAETCAAVRRTAKHEKYPGRAQLPLVPAERSGPIVNLSVSKDTLPRALLLADRFIRTAEAIGWTLTDPAPPDPSSDNHRRWQQPTRDSETPAPAPTPPIARLLVDGEPLSFLIEERYRQDPREPPSRELAREKRDYFYHAPRVTMIPTGALRIVRIDSTCRWSPRRKTWYDQGRSLVEEKIPKILAAFHDRAQEIKAKRAEAERQRRECEERERLRKEKEERRAAHAKLISELERQAAAWHRARFMRRYIQAARRALDGKSIEATLRGEPINFLDWATAYVDQLDPLSPQPTNPDQAPPGPSSPSSSEL